MARVILMDIRTLKYFVEIARAGNVTRAAEILHMTQPALSKQLLELEDELGKKLFNRKSRGIELTEAGILLRHRAEEIIGLFDKAAEEFKSLDDVIGGDIRIGCAEADGFKHFVRILNELKKNYPRVRCHLYSSDSDSTTDKLDRGLLDFAIIAHGNINLKKYNHATLPAKNRWGLIIRRDSELAAKAGIERDDLLDIPLICSRQGLEEELLGWLGEVREKLQIVATYDMMFNAAIMVRENFGCALGYDGIIFTGEGSELCFRPLVPPQESPMHIIWKKHQAFTPIAKVLLNQIARLES